MNLQEIRDHMRPQADPDKARILQGFFKTGPGEYGEGDIFIGITVPTLRALARSLSPTLASRTLRALLRSRVHEERLLGLLVLVDRFKRGDARTRSEVFRTYRAHLDFINNWDLVDLTAPYIVGPYLQGRSRQQLYRWARSRDLWRRRIAIVATFHLIRRHEMDDTLALADILLHDGHDLIHKAVGWMLREVGKRDQARLETFLADRYPHMPRTMLRYAIERFPEPLRQRYLKGTV